MDDSRIARRIEQTWKDTLLHTLWTRYIRRKDASLKNKSCGSIRSNAFVKYQFIYLIYSKIIIDKI